MTNPPKDWFRPTTIDGEPAYNLTHEGVIFFTMKTDGDVATHVQVEIAQIVAAWWCGRLFPRSQCRALARVLDDDRWEGLPPEPVPQPVEIAGGVAGLQRLLVAKAEENRGRNPAELKQLFDQHEVVVAVWRSTDKTHGPGFLTLKGTEHLLVQAKRGAKKFRATITAITCNNREHAELLQKAFVEQGAAS